MSGPGRGRSARALGVAAAGWALSAALATAQPAPPLALQDLWREREAVRFAAGETRQALAHPFLQFASEVVRGGDSLWVRNRDYGIDYGRGVLFLLARPTSPVEVAVEYLYLPGPRRRSFRAVDIVPREDALAGAPKAAPDTPAATATRRIPSELTLPPTLRLAGSKTIGVTLGRNREASIDQSLRVEAAGELGDDLRVNAVLADDDLPVLPEGNTEELGDLSKVFIELQGPVVGGVLGDHVLERPEGEFTALRRDLRGGELRLRFGDETVAVGAGLAKGELATATFRGSEGNQGPYELLSARRLEFSTVVPGSERVYMDGQLLRRGDNQDYVIDYDRGELRFTSQRRVTADSEIGVDFQVANQRYRRETRSARLAGSTHGVRWTGFAFDEGDVRDRPVGGDYEPEEIAALAAAGDRIAIAPGIRVVGAGRGLYRRDVVDSTVVVFDAVAGDLEVDFYETVAGAYSDSLDALSGRRIFRFVGDGRGGFAIGRRLTPAGRHRLATAALVATPWAGASVAGEASVSRFDANQFSSLDDDDNEGEALDLRFDTGPRALGRAGALGLQAHASQLSARFHAPGRGRPAFYYKNWNAESDSLRDSERLGEATLRWNAAGERVRLAANMGRLDRRGDLRTDRAQVDVGLGPRERGVELVWQGLDTARPGLGAGAGRSRDLRLATGRFRVGPLLPEVRVESDEFVRADIDSFARPSYRYVDARARLALAEWRRTTAAVEVARRDTDARRTSAERAAGLAEWAPSRRNDTWAIDVMARPTLALTTELGMSRRTNEPRGAEAGAETRSDLARAVVGWSPRRAARAEWRYEIGDEAVRTLQQVLVLAPDGRGDYDAEGRPVGKDQGLYDKVFRFAGEPERVASIEASLRFDLGGFSTLGGVVADTTASWLRRNVSLLQVVGVKEQTRSDRRRDLYLLVPAAFQTGATVFGTFTLRQEWSFLNAAPRDALKLSLDAQKEVDGRFQGDAVRARRATATLRWDRTGIARWSVGAEGAYGWRDRRGALDAIVPGRPSAGAHDVRFGRALARTAYRLSASDRLQVDVESTVQRDALSTASQRLLALSPSATLAPLRNLRLFANVAATRVQEDKPPDALPPFFFDAPGTKTTGSFTGSYRLSQNLNLNLTYTGVRNTDGRSTWDVKAETRAIF
jgi:hypothetical protein